MEPNSLKHQAMIFLACNSYRHNTDKSGNIIILPELFQQIIETRAEIELWNVEINFISSTASREIRLDGPNLKERLRLNDHFLRWESSASSISIDRRATAARILDLVEPMWHQRTHILEMALALASFYCLESQIRRLWPHSNQTRTQGIAACSAVSYWRLILLNQPQLALNELLTLFPTQQSLDSEPKNGGFWLSVLKSFWPIIERELGPFIMPTSSNWLLRAMLGSVEYSSNELLLAYLWTRVPVDCRLEFVICSDFALLRSIVNKRRHVIFLEIWDAMNDLWRKRTFHLVHNCLIGNTLRGDALIIIEHILRWALAIYLVDDPWIEEATRWIEFVAVRFWKALEPRVRRVRRYWDDNDDLLALVVLLCSMDEVKRIWDELEEAQRVRMITSDKCAVFRNACAMSRLVLVEFLWTVATPDQRHEFLTARNAQVLNSACEKCNISLLHCLHDLTSASGQLLLDDFGSIRAASLSHLICSAEIFSAIPTDPRNEQLKSLLLLLISDVSLRSFSNNESLDVFRMKSIFLNALLFENGKAYKCLCQLADADGYSIVFRAMMRLFDEEEKAQLLLTLRMG